MALLYRLQSGVCLLSWNPTSHWGREPLSRDPMPQIWASEKEATLPPPHHPQKQELIPDVACQGAIAGRDLSVIQSSSIMLLRC